MCVNWPSLTHHYLHRTKWIIYSSLFLFNLLYPACTFTLLRPVAFPSTFETFALPETLAPRFHLQLPLEPFLGLSSPAAATATEALGLHVQPHKVVVEVTAAFLGAVKQIVRD